MIFLFKYLPYHKDNKIIVCRFIGTTKGCKKCPLLRCDQNSPRKSLFGPNFLGSFSTFCYLSYHCIILYII